MLRISLVFSFYSCCCDALLTPDLHTFENSPLTTVDAVAEGSVLLPCDLTPPLTRDAPILVLFFFGNKGTPIYSVDARGQLLSSGEHWSDADQLGTRAVMRIDTAPHGLFLSRLVVEDDGLYHCRVDFKASPTRNLRIRLCVIVPPRHLLIMSSLEGTRVVSGTIGPYSSGSRLTLLCQVTGGRPRPTLTWWREGVEVDDVVDYSTDQMTQNELVVEALSRQHLLTKFTCVANNSNLTLPLSQSVSLDIAFAPTTVRVFLPSEDKIWDELLTARDRSATSVRHQFQKQVLYYQHSPPLQQQPNKVSSTSVHDLPPPLPDGGVSGGEDSTAKTKVATVHERTKSSGKQTGGPREQLEIMQSYLPINYKKDTKSNYSKSTVNVFFPKTSKLPPLTEDAARMNVFPGIRFFAATKSSDYRAVLNDTFRSDNENENKLNDNSELSQKHVDAITVRTGHRAVIVCEAKGSRPNPEYFWKIDGHILKSNDKFSKFSIADFHAKEEMKNDVSLVESTATISVSILEFVPSIADHNSIIDCEACSPRLRNVKLQKGIKLNVQYPPEVSLTYKSPVEKYELKEGDMFSLECKIMANPAVSKIYWTRDDAGVQHSPRDGILLTDTRLVVSRASRALSGRYTCSARNSEGSASAPSMHVSVRFAPVCSRQQQRQYGAALREIVNITCLVESNPQPLSFRWAFNRSSHITEIKEKSAEFVRLNQAEIKASNFFVELPNYRYEPIYSMPYTPSTSVMNENFDKASDVLLYRVDSEMDFGTVLCWATNAVAAMRTPCVINVVPAARPDAVKKCSVSGLSGPKKDITVRCVPGWDGGMRQTFILEVIKSNNVNLRSLAFVQHSNTPLFHLKGIGSEMMDEEYVFLIKAMNTRGISAPYTMTFMFAKTDNRQKKLISHDLGSYYSNRNIAVSWSVFIAMLAGVFLTLVTTFAAVLYIINLKTNVLLPNNLKFQDNQSGVHLATNGVAMRRTTAQEVCGSLHDSNRDAKCREHSSDALARKQRISWSHTDPFFCTIKKTSSMCSSTKLPSDLMSFSSTSVSLPERQQSVQANRDTGSSPSRPSLSSLMLSNYGGRSTTSPIHPLSDISLEFAEIIPGSSTCMGVDPTQVFDFESREILNRSPDEYIRSFNEMNALSGT